MKIKIRLRAVYFALLFFGLVFAVVIYAIYTGDSQNPNFLTAAEVFLGLGFLSILGMLLGK